MALMFPREAPRTPRSEADVYKALQRLDDRWYVLHSVAWQSERAGRQGDGEADFVLLHPDHGLVVLEVKGGSDIYVADGDWYTVNSRTHEHFPIKNPFGQARDSKHALIKYLRGLPARLVPMSIAHGVVFPGLTLTDGVGPEGPRQIIIDATDLLDAPRSVDRLVQHWEMHAALPGEHVAEIVRRLAPTVAIRKRMSTNVEVANAELLKLTDQQRQAFRITRSLRRAAVSGGPGTGKTVLALERAIQLADDGFDVLLTCFNAPLADEMTRAAADSTVDVTTFHSLCMSQARKADLPIGDGQQWWDRDAADALVDAAQRNGLSYDAVIIDEGQDFSPDWITALRMLLRNADDGITFIFYDPRQALLESWWELPGDLETFPLDWNCRNTLSIASKVARVYGDDVLTLGTEGEGPSWVKAADTDAAVRVAQEIADTLVSDEGLEPTQIVVLTDSRPAADRLQQMTISDASFTALGGTGVTAETVYRYKGLEADVVLLVIANDDLLDDERRALAYVGMSRARTLLYVIGPKRTRATIGWDDPG